MEKQLQFRVDRFYRNADSGSSKRKSGYPGGRFECRKQYHSAGKTDQGISSVSGSSLGRRAGEDPGRKSSRSGCKSRQRHGWLLQLAQMEESQILVTAIVGMIGIRPTIAAIQAGKDIALANKETLVTAGHLIMPMAKEKGVQILPVDSEHSAIFQAIHGEDKREIHKLLITASGGPFRGMKASDLAHVKVEDALKHPNWAMGQKITIDSATLVNKGLEVMEAKWLF